jgi:hypothetical protein
MDLGQVGWGHEVDRSGSGQGQVAVSCECGNESSGSTKYWGISCLAEDLSASQEGLSTE